MRRLGFAVIFGIVGLGLTGAAQAEGYGNAGANAGANEGQQQTQGWVKSIDRKHGTFQIQGSDRIYQVTGSTEIFKNNSAASLYAVNPGDQVIAMYSGNQDARTLTVDRMRAWSRVQPSFGAGRR